MEELLSQIAICSCKNFEQFNWDNFDDLEIRSALDEILEFIRVGKMGQTKQISLENERRNDSNDVTEEILTEQVWPVSNFIFLVSQYILFNMDFFCLG